MYQIDVNAYPNAFILSLDFEEEIKVIRDVCIQRNYIMSNFDFQQIMILCIRVVNAGGDIPSIASRMDTLVSTICCFVEQNFIVPGGESVSNEVAYEILFELEQLLMQEINSFITKFLNKMQLVYSLISVDNYGFIVTPFNFEVMDVHSFGHCNIKVCKK